MSRYSSADARYGHLAELAVLDHYRSKGRTSSGLKHKPFGDYGTDIVLYSTNSQPPRPVKLIEVERRSAWNSNDVFPYETVRIPWRRGLKKFDELLIVRADCRRAVVVTPKMLEWLPLTEVDTRRGKDRFYSLPREDARYRNLK